MAGRRGRFLSATARAWSIRCPTGSFVDVGDAVAIEVRARSEALLDGRRSVGAPNLEIAGHIPVVPSSGGVPGAGVRRGRLLGRPPGRGCLGRLLRRSLS